MSEILELEKNAESLKEAGQFEESIAEYKKILDIDENFVRAHMGLSVVYERAGDVERSVFHAEKACELEPNEQFNFIALSVTYQKAFEGTRDPNFKMKAEDVLARAHMMNE